MLKAKRIPRVSTPAEREERRKVAAKEAAAGAREYARNQTLERERMLKLREQRLSQTKVETPSL
jgi:hypothetical protein